MVEWNDEKIEEIVSYINQELSKGRTQRQIEEQDFGVVERTIAKRLNRRQYKKKDNVWYKAGEAPAVSNNKNLAPKVPTEVTAPSSRGYVIEDEDSFEKMLDLIAHSEELIAMAKEWDKRYSERYDRDDLSDDGVPEIKIELPLEQNNNFKSSFRVNEVVWRQFNIFAEKNKIYKKMDLISMALKEYMERYDK
ncbi:hypothetical protein [Clostridium beijerinckii]|uniref:hypothetical protein n=1 Tax=Clostridium beijerinckii TaxID=1520 RepID=UPI00232D5090|nr:hypothetical protein [Clostridium beijerinckii]